MVLDKLCFHSVGTWYLPMQSALRLLRSILSGDPGRFISKYTPALLLYPARNFNSPRTRWTASCGQRPPLFSEALLGQVLNDLPFHDSRSNCNAGNLHFNHFSFYVPRSPDTFRCRHPLSAIVVTVPSILLHIPVTKKTKAGQCTDYPSYFRNIVDTLIILCYTYDLGMKRL
jgi:hypothetical protein